MDKTKKGPTAKKKTSEPEPELSGETRRYTDARHPRANPNFIQGTIEPTEKK